MKKTLLVGLAIGVVTMAASSAFAAAWNANVGGNGILGSSHDLSYNTNAATADAQSRICVFCHHPHNALKAGGTVGAYSPLWNRNMSAKTFTAYNNGNMMGSASTSQHTLNAGSNVLSGVSLLCMSCHDGAVAMDAYSQASGSSSNAGDNNGMVLTRDAQGRGAGFTSGDSGGDMSNHHPMGFAYQAVQSADNEIAGTSTVMVTAAMNGGTAITIGDLLNGTGVSAKMECVTCHDVHNSANATGAERFLWRSNNRSNFCLTCHLK